MIKQPALGRDQTLLTSASNLTEVEARSLRSCRNLMPRSRHSAIMSARNQVTSALPVEKSQKPSPSSTFNYLFSRPRGPVRF